MLSIYLPEQQQKVLSKITDKLKDVFGYDQFRGNQEAIIENLLAGNHTFVIMPTGAGKSMCYQLPALLMEGTAIVISPLIALMKNQVDQLRALGIDAYMLNSTLTKGEMTRVKKKVLAGEAQLLYVAPESLTKEENVEFLKQAKISFVAIDEAHCISEWGHDFRPEYRRIRSIISQFGDLPIIALTATATPKVQLDIQRNLGLEDAKLYKSSFNRENLYYEVRPKKNIDKQLIKFILDRKGQAGIIYCLSRKKVEEVANLLKVNGVKAAPYHAGLEAGLRVKNQDDFLNEELEVIVATIAFGMGIDKPDVRFVIHYDAPKSLEGYYQETGRAGRDGLNGHCLLFYSYNDIVKLEKFNKDKPVTERENAKMLLEEVASFSESAVCRRKQLLHYFGEHREKDCGFCDNCKNPKERFDAQKEIVIALKTCLLTKERFGINHLVNVVRGSQNQYVMSYEHNELEVYGLGKGDTDEDWKSIFRAAMINQFLEKDIDNYGVLKMTDAGKAFIENPHEVLVPKGHDYRNMPEEDEVPAITTKSYDKVLFGQLLALRKEVAKRKKVPPYVVFSEPSLEEMAITYPCTMEGILQIQGVGQGKAAKFGKPFIELINKYVSENDIETADEITVKTAGDRSKDKIFIIQQIDRKVNLDELAEGRNWDFFQLLEEMEHICFSGTKLNIDYFLEDIMDEEMQDELRDYFMAAETDDIEEALDELGEDFAEDEIRLMRIKIYSDLAN
ncbi:DNA helicase RecQ [Persicobacter diffluens]|uniref:DNA helicase RecQ n=1 Tax=Persicobacter diffluens TaxID=981 RepID=A0AAN4VVT6_9BACT|nr:ATP-dependent DNA helicase RecQ [Persicobacter diffluens]